MIVLIRIQDAFILLPLRVILIVSACFYMNMNCFGPIRVVSSLLRVGSVAADIFGWVVADGFGWLRMVSGGFGWFRMVSGGFRWYVDLVVTLDLVLSTAMLKYKKRAKMLSNLKQFELIVSLAHLVFQM